MPLESDVFASQNPQPNQAQVTQDAAKVQGRVRSVVAKWTADGSEGTAPVIDIVKLPLGAYVIDAEVVVRVVGPAGSATLGDAADADRYVTGINQTSAGFAGTRAASGAGYKIPNEAGRDVKLTTVGSIPSGMEVDVLLRWAQT